MKFKAICENHLYSKAYSKGKRYVTQNIAVHILPDYSANRLMKAHPLHQKVNRIGLTVSKKLGNAVCRNRVKRILRAGMQKVQREEPLKVGFLIVIVAREGATHAKAQDIAKDLCTAFRRLELIRT